MTVVFDQTTALTGTDDGNGNGGISIRVLCKPASLSAATGTQVRITVRFGTAEASEAGAITDIFCGRSSGTNGYLNPPSRVTFSGGNTISGSAAGVVVSDFITLPESYDNTQGFLISFDVAAGKNCNISTATFANGDFWFGTGNPASQQAAPGAYTLVSGNAAFIEKIEIQAAASGFVPYNPWPQAAPILAT